MTPVPARIVYQVFTRRISQIQQVELDAVIARYPVPTGYLEVDAREVAEHTAEAIQVQYRDFSPPIDFEQFKVIHRAQWLYRIEAREVEPEDLGYLRSAMRIAGEIAALTQGIIVDVVANWVRSAEDIVHQIERPFDPLDHVSIHVEADTRPFWVHTHGMEKFAHADFQIVGVPRGSVEVAVELLRHLSTAVVSGGSYRPGESTQLCGFAFDFLPSRSLRDNLHFSSETLTLSRFQLVRATDSPAMEGMLILSSDQHP
jgi:hypothetical protein